ncbi:hypothetical protein LX81_02132 [Palleronia aestuarii]|uniref:Hda lid domain-containing protein n=1 Tax=Palleronia aestuarii TaxID=568105 RepID=A0A2W7N8C6_9RHOB|nr:chromosomal replication initiator DnaA [Palleronia aestuarii]PZX16280.1 hypothetical protein LX81_02132 [Palleronia aestuarii]
MIARQLPFDLPVRPALDREAFFVSPANADAVALLDDDARWPGGKLLLTGPEASGKTHLAHVWAARGDAVVVAAEQLGRLDVPTLARARHVVVEDIPAIAGRRREEAALFHLHNLVLAEGGRLLLTGRGRPASWPIGLPDLASRIRATAPAMLDAPDDPLLGALLMKHFRDRQLVVPEPLVPYLLARMRRTAAAARAIAAELDRLSLAEHHRVTLPMARRALEADPTPDKSEED